MGETRSYLGGRGNYQIVGALGKRTLMRMVELIEREGWIRCGGLVALKPGGMYYETLVRPKYKFSGKPLRNCPIRRIHDEDAAKLVEEVEWFLRKGWKINGGIYRNYYGDFAQELIKE